MIFYYIYDYLLAEPEPNNLIQFFCMKFVFLFLLDCLNLLINMDYTITYFPLFPTPNIVSEQDPSCSVSLVSPYAKFYTAPFVLIPVINCNLGNGEVK